MIRRALLAVAASLTIHLPVHATSVLPLYLDEIVDTASVAFEGTVVSSRSTRDEATGFVVTYTTFKVHEVLKGDAGETYTIKQVGGELPAQGIREKSHGVPRFTTGQSLVVFLYGASQAGFSSPVGLEQGRFMISDETDGPAVTNGRDFRDMTREKVQSDKAVKHLPLADFKKLVRDRVTARVEGSQP
jgi:hypothetical protein